MATAKEIMDQRPVFLDTETTGLGSDAEIVEIAVIDTDGSVLLESLVKPVRAIPAGATAIHGITDADVAAAPTIIDLWPRLRSVVDGRMVVIYNASYDLNMLCQSLLAHESPEGPTAGRQFESFCAMEWYAEYWGDWNDWHQSFRWQRLEAACYQQKVTLPPGLCAHRARADAEATRLLLTQIVERQQ